MNTIDWYGLHICNKNFTLFRFNKKNLLPVGFVVEVLVRSVVGLDVGFNVGLCVTHIYHSLIIRSVPRANAIVFVIPPKNDVCNFVWFIKSAAI